MLTHSHSDGEFPIYSQGEVKWFVDVVNFVGLFSEKSNFLIV